MKSKLVIVTLVFFVLLLGSVQLGNAN